MTVTFTINRLEITNPNFQHGCYLGISGWLAIDKTSARIYDSEEAAVDDVQHFLELRDNLLLEWIASEVPPIHLDEYRVFDEVLLAGKVQLDKQQLYLHACDFAILYREGKEYRLNLNKKHRECLCIHSRKEFNNL